MGLREREAEKEKQRQVAKAAAIAAANLEQQFQQAKENERQQLIELDKTHAPYDDQAVIKLLESLPFKDLGNYLIMVQDGLAYEHETVVYSRSTHTSGSTKDVAYYHEMNDRLRGVGLDPNYFVPNTEGGEASVPGFHKGFGVLHPSKMFCGDAIEPKIGRLSILPPWSQRLFEPQVPGLGIALRRQISSTESLKHKNGRDIISIATNYDSVYVRFMAEGSVVITGNAEILPVTSAKVFELALEQSLKRPHSLTVFTEKKPSNGFHL